jgi:hypothetical protein
MYPIRSDRLKHREWKKIKETVMHERLNEEIQRENMKGKSHTKDRKIRKK